MRQIIENKIAKTEFREKLRNGLRGFTIRFLFQFLIPLTSFAQENPWVSTPSEENPWTTEKETVVTSDSSSSAPKDLSSYRKFVLHNDTVLMPKNDQDLIYKTLQEHGKSLDKSNGYIGLGFAGGFTANIFAYPVCLGISLIETKKSKKHIQDFKKANPKASEEEVKKVKSGLAVQRAKKTFIGVTSGIGTLVMIIVASIMSF